ncbi:CGNR zinc finger domain-containing protein [Cryptosporangium arvum]|uniref:Conserved protein containing a Zn-ribbon-like motif, possibly RNA-binding n=1 Tax=Cryptosporangium arvum DSM 44712 TaxID=927661 RepID=A0A010ZTP9_9ACTN|nr:CGNR zinc finger domain-containing protein [Cryptosporangium arvum]EXG82079.1 conserved protein containing a Zn-ribbon-like motif, possibly RNA-binding [Cryptosporangium arvum DSM 44712]
MTEAPGGLRLVQDLLNTAGMPVASLPDLLDETSTAQRWLDGTLRAWARQTGRTTPSISLTEKDLAALRTLRGRVRGWVTGESENDGSLAMAADVSVRDGDLVYGPRGRGAAAITSLVALEALLASRTGELGRLKTCQNPACGAAFYDRSRSGTRVWHDMKTCGNTLNLRASRARRRQSSTA